MAKVAIDIRLIGNQRTGDETVFFELTKVLIHEHPEHQYILLTDKKGNELAKVRERLDIANAVSEVELVSFGPTNKFVWNAFTMPIFLWKRKEIAIFHTQYILPFFIPERIQVVAHIHDISFARYPEYIGKNDIFFLNLLIPRTMKRATLVTPSQFTKNEVMEVYAVPESNVTVIPNAPGEEFLAAGHEKEGEKFSAIRSKYQLPEEYFLYVGTLQPRKNIPYLLEIFAQYQAQYPEEREKKLVVVGNRKAHNFDRGIDEAIERLHLKQEIIFPGYIEARDLPDLYSNARAFVFPSLYEGFGIPLLEALASGVPTFASDIPVHHEVGDGRVHFFPLSDVVKAAQILYTIPITEHGNSNTKEYSWTRSACLLARLYQKISNKS